MQYIIVITSRYHPLSKEEGWITNGVNRKGLYLILDILRFKKKKSEFIFISVRRIFIFIAIWSVALIL